MGPWKCPVHTNKCTSRFVCAGTGRRVQGLPQSAQEMNTAHSLVKQPSPQPFAHTSHSPRNLLHTCTHTRTFTDVGTHTYIHTHVHTNTHTEEFFSTHAHTLKMHTCGHTDTCTHSLRNSSPHTLEHAHAHEHTLKHACTLTEEPFFLLLIPPKRNLSPATRLPLPFFLESLAPLFFFLTPGPGRCNKGCNDQHCH